MSATSQVSVASIARYWAEAPELCDISTSSGAQHSVADLRFCLERCADLLAAMEAPSPADLLNRLAISGMPDGERLIVHAQNPANNHHWTMGVGRFTAGEIRAALSKAAPPKTEGAG